MKKTLREKYLMKRRSIPSKKAREDAAALRDVFMQSRFSSYDNVMLYRSFGKEMSVDGIISPLQKKGCRTYVPVVVDSHEMTAVEINRFTVFENDSFGIPTPVDGTEADPGKMELILVPGVVFDEKGGRLGHGAGYYDRFLKKAVKAIRIGVAYEFQIIPEIGCLDENDVPMDYIITEKGIRNCK